MKRMLLLKISGGILCFQAACAFQAGNDSSGIAFLMLGAYFWFHRNWNK
tara:strand:+ start:1468 stop:1614 length:147 start_codon:yes stop_codon:yes gene_type:complete